MGCHRDVKAGCYEGHKCTPSLTGGEEREASLLKWDPEQGIIQLPTGGIDVFSVTYIVMSY